MGMVNYQNRGQNAAKYLAGTGPRRYDFRNLREKSPQISDTCIFSFFRVKILFFGPILRISEGPRQRLEIWSLFFKVLVSESRFEHIFGLSTRFQDFWDPTSLFSEQKVKFAISTPKCLENTEKVEEIEFLRSMDISTTLPHHIWRGVGKKTP